MAIIPLPETTVHLLGSAQVLTTATALVKELVDNALDAKATSIDICIAQDTLSKIEVRDNGHGVPKEDVDFLGRRGHTSKIRSFDEVRTIGGVSLGFRGEALSSAVQLADVTITTKTDGEPVAMCVKLKATGGIDKQSHTSHPVGTTVSVTRFMDEIPVRKQTALKQAPKTLSKIKELLQAYALARPSIRFTLKIPKGGKTLWSFSPHPNDGIREVTSAVIGRDAALQCIEIAMEFPEVTPIHGTEGLMEEGQKSSKQTAKGRFLAEAFLPKRDADSAKVGQGQFISVDSRPVSCEKGTVKKVVVMYKSYIKNAFSGCSETVRNPFLRLNIKCPPGTYDPNIEPAKDDVIFANEAMILESIQKLFNDVYGELKKEPTLPVSRQNAKRTDNFELLLARKGVPATSATPVPLQSSEPFDTLESPSCSVSPPTSRRSMLPLPDLAVNLPGSRLGEMLLESPSSTTSSFRLGPKGKESDIDKEERKNRTVGGGWRKWDLDMSLDMAESVEEAQQPAPQKKASTSEIEQGIEAEVWKGQKNSLNPWIVAKMAAPTLPKSGPASFQSPSITTPAPRFRTSFLPTPQTSSDPILEEPINDTRILRQRDRQIDAGLETPMSNLRRANDFVLARDLVNSTPAEVQLVGQHEKVHSLKGPNRPFVSPKRRHGEVSSGGCLHQIKLPVALRTARTEELNNIPSPLREIDPEVAWAMDFEHRKEAATRRRREETRAAHAAKEPDTQPAEPRWSPHKHRYNAAIAALDTAQTHSREAAMQEVDEPLKTTLPDGDPRAYLMRRQKSMALQAGKADGKVQPMRAKSTRLPLENVPAGNLLHNVALNIPADISSLRGGMALLAKHDKYMCRGEFAHGLPVARRDRDSVSKRIQEVVKGWKENGAEYEVEYMWENMVSAT